MRFSGQGFMVFDYIKIPAILRAWERNESSREMQAARTLSQSMGIPLIDSLTPDHLRPGQRNIELCLSGRNLGNVINVLFLRQGVSVQTFRLESYEQMIVTVSVDETASSGYRNVLVVDPDCGIGVGQNALFIESGKSELN
jgi:hypothetical protein